MLNGYKTLNAIESDISHTLIYTKFIKPII